MWPACYLARLGGGWGSSEPPLEASGGPVVGEGEAGETGPAPWAVLESRPRSLAVWAARFQRRVQPSEAAQPEAVAWSLEPRRGVGISCILLRHSIMCMFHVLGSFRAAGARCSQDSFSRPASCFHLIHFLEC